LLALVAHLVLAAAALRVLVAEPRSDLVARTVEEAAIVTAAIAIAIVGPSGAFITLRVARVVPVICHVVLQDIENSPGASPGEPEAKTILALRPFLRIPCCAAPIRQGDNLPGQARAVAASRAIGAAISAAAAGRRLSFP
jgi:hypothetical protein